MAMDNIHLFTSLTQVNLDPPSLDFLRSLLRNKVHSKNKTELKNIIAFVSEAKENEKRLVNKCRTLHAMLKTSEKKTETVNVLNREDKTMMESLKNQLEESWRIIDEMYDKEEKSIAHVAGLEKEICSLKSQVKIENSPDVQNLLTMHEKLEKHNKQMEEKLIEYGEHSRRKSEAERSWKREKDDLLKEIAKQSQQIDAAKTRFNNESKKRGECEKEIKKLKSAAEVQSVKSHTSNSSYSASLQKQLASRNKAFEKIQTEYESNKSQLEQLERKFQDKDSIIMNLKEANKITHEKLINVENQAKDMNVMLENAKLELQNANQKYENARTANDLTLLNESCIQLKLDFETLHEKYNEKTLLIQQAENLKDEIENQNCQLLYEISNLKKQVTDKSKQNEYMSEKNAYLSGEVKARAILIEQLEEARNKYIYDMGSMQEEIQNLQEKVKELQYLLSKPEDTLLQRSEDLVAELDSDIHSANEAEIEILKEKLSLKEQLVECLQDAVETLKDQMKQNALNTENKSSQTIECVDSIDKPESGDFQLSESNEVLNIEQDRCETDFFFTEENQMLKSHIEMICDVVTLLKEKVTIKNEVIRRKSILIEAISAEMNHLKGNMVSLKTTIHNQEDWKVKQEDFSEPSTTRSESITDGNSNIEHLKSKLKILEETLAVQTNELQEKSERMKGQFEVIEQLRKCISSSSTSEMDLKKVHREYKNKDDTIKCLREKVSLYETYIKDYQEEVKKLYSKLEDTKKLQNARDLMMGKRSITSSLLQTKKIELTHRKMKYKGGGYRLN